MKQLFIIVIFYFLSCICIGQKIPRTISFHTTFPVNFNNKIYGINSCELQSNIYGIGKRKWRSIDFIAILKYTILNTNSELKRTTTIISPMMNFEHYLLSYGASSWITLNGRIGYGISNKNYFHIGYGLISNTVIAKSTYLNIILMQNNLIGSKLNFLEIGFGITRSLI